MRALEKTVAIAIRALDVPVDPGLNRAMLRCFLLLPVLMFLAACTRPPELVGVDNPERPVASVAQATKMKIFMATTREASDVTGAFFSDQRAPELSLTSVTVSIPPNHVTGNIERPRDLPPDPSREFAIIEPTIYGGESAFIASLNRELATRAPGDREILFFVHGYNTTTTDALLRLAQFTEDTEFNGVPVLFSWASAGRVTRYVYDLNSALLARRHLLNSARILLGSRTKGIHVFAHSMGTFLTVEAIVQAELYGAHEIAKRIENVMLAAPDIDLDLFREQLNYIPEEHRNFYVFVNDQDRALSFSSRISGGIDRVGAADAAEFAGLGVTVIDLSDVEDSAAGTHSVFAGSPEVVAVIGRGLQNDHLHAAPRSPTLVEVLDGAPVLRSLTP